jgi:hypothetical protein
VGWVYDAPIASTKKGRGATLNARSQHVCLCICVSVCLRALCACVLECLCGRAGVRVAAGVCHGVSVWFELRFEGKDVALSLPTSPWDHYTHWYQTRCVGAGRPSTSAAVALRVGIGGMVTKACCYAGGCRHGVLLLRRRVDVGWGACCNGRRCGPGPAARFLFATPLSVASGSEVSGSIRITHKTKKAMQSDATFQGAHAPHTAPRVSSSCSCLCPCSWL